MSTADEDHILKIGAIDVVALSDGRMPMPTQRLFPETPEEIWTPYRSRFPEAFDANGFMINLGAFLVRTGGRMVLVDTGLGPISMWPTLWPKSPEARPGPAELLDDLRAKGTRPEEIDTVFLTHLHGDHVGWNLTKDAGGDWSPTFPKARYLVHRSDWERFTQPQFLDSGGREAAERNYLPLDDLGALDLIEGDHQIAPGLTAIHVPGHTPGHMGMLISSDNQRAVIVGDLVGGPAHVSEPDWPYAPDFDATQARESRHRLLDQAEEGGMVVMGSHMTRPGWGRLIRWEGKRYWQAL